MNRSALICATAVALLGACSGEQASEPLLGTLEWDRVSVNAEASEAILRIDVVEGAEVEQGAPILALDARRIDARIAQAFAVQRGAEAALAELRSGSRSETIAAARATLAGADATTANSRRERDRIAEVRKRGLVAQAELDRVETALRNARAQGDAARANLAELLNGTRIEDIDQAEAALADAVAQVAQLALTRARYDVRAPRTGRIDALPYKLGDQPPPDAVLVSLLTGKPYARVYVPASRRAELQIGARCRVHVQGVDAEFSATLRSVRADPAFTPYYALTGDDASRLAYRAELELDGTAATLAAGLPLSAECAMTTPASG